MGEAEIPSIRKDFTALVISTVLVNFGMVLAYISELWPFPR